MICLDSFCLIKRKRHDTPAVFRVDLIHEAVAGITEILIIADCADRLVGIVLILLRHALNELAVNGIACHRVGGTHHLTVCCDRIIEARLGHANQTCPRFLQITERNVDLRSRGTAVICNSGCKIIGCSVCEPAGIRVGSLSLGDQLGIRAVDCDELLELCLIAGIRNIVHVGAEQIRAGGELQIHRTVECGLGSGGNVSVIHQITIEPYDRSDNLCHVLLQVGDLIILTAALADDHLALIIDLIIIEEQAGGDTAVIIDDTIADVELRNTEQLAAFINKADTDSIHQVDHFLCGKAVVCRAEAHIAAAALRCRRRISGHTLRRCGLQKQVGCGRVTAECKVDGVAKSLLQLAAADGNRSVRRGKAHHHAGHNRKKRRVLEALRIADELLGCELEGKARLTADISDKISNSSEKAAIRSEGHFDPFRRHQIRRLDLREFLLTDKNAVNVYETLKRGANIFPLIAVAMQAVADIQCGVQAVPGRIKFTDACHQIDGIFLAAQIIPIGLGQLGQGFLLLRLCSHNGRLRCRKCI